MRRRDVWPLPPNACALLKVPRAVESEPSLIVLPDAFVNCPRTTDDRDHQARLVLVGTAASRDLDRTKTCSLSRGRWKRSGCRWDYWVHWVFPLIILASNETRHCCAMEQRSNVERSCALHLKLRYSYNVLVPEATAGSGKKTWLLWKLDGFSSFWLFTAQPAAQLKKLLIKNVCLRNPYFGPGSSSYSYGRQGVRCITFYH